MLRSSSSSSIQNINYMASELSKKAREVKQTIIGLRKYGGNTAYWKQLIAAYGWKRDKLATLWVQNICTTTFLDTLSLQANSSFLALALESLERANNLKLLNIFCNLPKKGSFNLNIFKKKHIKPQEGFHAWHHCVGNLILQYVL